MIIEKGLVGKAPHAAPGFQRRAQPLLYLSRRSGGKWSRYSIAGFAASIVTVDGKPDGAPKMDPLTVQIIDKQGAPLLLNVVFPATEGTIKVDVEAANDGVKERMNRLPKTDDSPMKKIMGIMVPLIPEAEISARLATVNAGQLSFK